MEHLGGQTFATPSNQALTIPGAATAVQLEAEGGICYYAVNQSGAGVTSHGYLADGELRLIGPLVNLETMHIHAPAATRIHVQYLREG
jgi:hypothetical protein